ncbi:hypothetical protein HDU78_011212 [Chytriomyces hyalinus]|nr:hypothetical protein HDU78_011212 [Chytriomyces hyalinus]
MSPSPTTIFTGATVETSGREHAQSLKTQEASLRETLARLEREEISLREQLKQIDPAHWERTGRIEWQDMQLRFVENTLRLQHRNRHSKKANEDGDGDEENDGIGDGAGGGLETLSNTYGRNPLGVPKSLMEAAGTNRGLVEVAIGRKRRRRQNGNERNEEGGGGDEEDGGRGGEGGIDFVQAENAVDGEIPDPDPQFFDFLAWVDAHVTGEEYGDVAEGDFDSNYFAPGGEAQHDAEDSDSDEADNLDEEECIDELEQSLVRELQQLERMRFGFGREVDFVDSEASSSEL